MALVSRLSPQRIDIPHEPGEWIEYRPISAAAMDRVQTGLAGKTPSRIAIEIAAECITRWSYPVEPTADNIADLDVATLDWLGSVDMQRLRSDVEKKDSVTASLLTSGLAAPGSPMSSGIS